MRSLIGAFRGSAPRMAVGTLLVVLASASLSTAAQSAATTNLCVGSKPGCFETIQAALDAAQDGDTIEIAPGMFAGGITILKDVQLVGAGAGATTIQGGGPVITIGEFVGPGGPGQPTVSISRVTITGGLNDSEGVAAGGGVLIPFAGPGVPVATVAISDSVITRNRVSPSGLFPPGPFCGPAPCAVAWGGGIDNAGALTLTNTRVTDNVAGSTPTDGSDATIAQGGGVRSHPGATTTLRRSFVTGNRSATTAPTGRFAEGGGISDNGVLTIEDSVVSDNSAKVDAAFAGDLDQTGAFGGGIQLIDTGSATITRTIVRGNVVRSTNSGGGSNSASGGIDADAGLLVLRDSLIDHNRVDVTVSAPGAIGIAFAGGVGIEGPADVSGTHFIGNEVRSSVPAGVAAASAAGLATFSDEPVVVRDSLVSGNGAAAVATGGFALAQGGGVLNAGLLTLRRTRIVANSGSSSGPAGSAEGGGLWNGIVPFQGFPALATLDLVDSVVAGNTLSASAGIPRLGGGIFTNVPFTESGTVIAGNQPDQCFGC